MSSAVLHNAEYEIIDQDPHFTRVVSYFRPSDYLKWGLFAASGPLYLFGASYVQSRGKKVHVSPRFLRYSVILGAAAGFFDRYAVSSLRFQGAKENKREVELDRYYVKSQLAQGKSPYTGDNENLLPKWIRSVAARNSTYSSLNLSVIPWFNFVQHEHHGVDLSKYYETRPGEEKWGFQLSK